MKEQLMLAEIREKTNFLGYEFLTWLFLFIDRNDAQQEIATIAKSALFKSDAKIVLGNRLVTCRLQNKEQKTSVNNPILEDSHEVFASLKNGHVIESLSLWIFFGETKVSMTINAHDFAISQVKIAHNFESEDNADSLHADDQLREEIFLRMSLLRDVESLIDKLVQRFVELRTDSKIYAELLKNMREQIEMRLRSYLHKDTRTTESMSLLSAS